MYRRSPILRAALSPSNKENVVASSMNAKELHRSIESKISQLVPSEDTKLRDEVVDTQIVVAEFVALFDKYRASTEHRISQLEAMEERLSQRFDDKLKEAREQIRIETIADIRDQLHSLESLGFLDVAVSNSFVRQQRFMGRIQSLRPSLD